MAVQRDFRLCWWRAAKCEQTAISLRKLPSRKSLVSDGLVSSYSGIFSIFQCCLCLNSRSYLQISGHSFSYFSSKCWTFPYIKQDVYNVKEISISFCSVSIIDRFVCLYSNEKINRLFWYDPRICLPFQKLGCFRSKMSRRNTYFKSDVSLVSLYHKMFISYMYLQMFIPFVFCWTYPRTLLLVIISCY